MKRDRETGLFFAQKIFQKIVLPPNFFRSRRVYTAERTERTMRNVSHILEKQLTDYLVTDQARFYRLAYSYLKNREEALDAVQTAVCRALEKQGELKEPEALRAWFYHILVHVCMDVLRSRKRKNMSPPPFRRSWTPGSAQASGRAGPAAVAAVIRWSGGLRAAWPPVWLC